MKRRLRAPDDSERSSLSDPRGVALYRPGQWFTVRPTLAEPHGKVVFAGEHLADWQGFMEGAVVTGEDAVAMLLD